VYNDSHRISKCIKSLLEQTYPSNLYEVIIVDNGSSDKTQDVIREFPVCLVIEDQIKGSYAARNKGIEIAKGEVLAFTDSDCIADKGWLEKGVYGLNQSQKTYAAGKIILTYQSKSPNSWEYFDSSFYFNQKGYIEDNGFGATANLFVYKKVMDKYGVFRTDLRSGGDYEFGRRLTENGLKGVYISSAVIHHPARSTFRENLVKSKRVSLGQSQLNNLGLLDHNQLTWRDFFPPKKIPQVENQTIAWSNRIKIWFIIWFFKIHNIRYRVFPRVPNE